jgi:protein-ribulosamine 3-kinase
VSLPDAVRRRVGERVGPVRALGAVGGGCINNATRVEVGGEPAFLKHNAHAPPGFFPAEARGLDALRSVDGGPRIPKVLATFDAATEGAPGEPSWLLLEWIEPGRRGPAFDERLGHAVTALHARADGGWGFGEDNFIGALPQSNGATDSWAEFWRGRRLEPQLRLARDGGRMPGSAAEWERLFAALPSVVAAAEGDGPSLLHGDLWSGNVMADAEGRPTLVDPAAYRGHREVDLAMAELFGGFGAAFHAAYREARPLSDGYAEVRRRIYQLFYLLVHVNLFGGGYVGQTAAALRQALAAV